MSLSRRLTLCAVAFVLISFQGAASAGSREQREVEMAGKSILSSIAVSASPQGRGLCSKVPLACVGANKAELGLALIGARKTPVSVQALVRLLRFRMDGSLAEDYECYVLKDSPLSETYLKQTKPADLERRCRSEVDEFVANDRQSLDGLDPETVCSSQDQIRRRMERLLVAVRAGRHCSESDF